MPFWIVRARGTAARRTMFFFFTIDCPCFSNLLLPPKLICRVLGTPLRAEMVWWLVSMSWCRINQQSLGWIWEHLHYTVRCSHLGRWKDRAWPSCHKGQGSTLRGSSGRGGVGILLRLTGRTTLGREASMLKIVPPS